MVSMRRWAGALLLFVLALGLNAEPTEQGVVVPKQIVLIAGPKSHLAGDHEYLKSVKLLKVLLDRAPNLKGVETKIYFNGWPEDPTVLDQASTIAWFADGENPALGFHAPYMTADRLERLDAQIKRGCGWFVHHFSVFAPAREGPRMLEWAGGYFDSETGHGEGGLFGSANEGARARYYSMIRVEEADVAVAQTNHAIATGVRPFRLRDEFYYQLKYRDKDERFRPLLTVPKFSADPQVQTIAWAVDRRDGGRGVGVTMGHRYANWQNEDYRKFVLNALIWSAGVPVPPGGVQSTYLDPAQVDRALLQRPLAVLCLPPAELAGNGRQEYVEALTEALNSEWPRFTVTTPESGEGVKNWAEIQLIVADQGALASWVANADVRRSLQGYLEHGGGMVVLSRKLPNQGPNGDSGEPWGRRVTWSPDVRQVAMTAQNRTEAVYHVVIGNHPAMHSIEDFNIPRIDVVNGRAPEPGFVIASPGDLEVVAADGKAPLGFVVPQANRGRVFQLIVGSAPTARAFNPRFIQMLRGGALWAAHDN